MQQIASRFFAPGAGLLAARLDGWAAAERGRFALWLPVFMGTGVVAYFSETSEPVAWLGAAGFGLAMAAAFLARGLAPLRGACWAAAALALGFASAQSATWRAPPAIDVPTHAVVVAGRVRAIEALPAGTRVTLEQPRFDAGPALPRLVRVRLRANDTLALATGDTMQVRALLSRPSPPAYPGGWDLQRDAFFSGIGAYGYALGHAEALDRASPAGPARWLQWLREAIAARIAAALPAEQAAIAATLLAGETSAIPAADRAAFRDSGLAHLLAIAGLHIGIVMGLIFGATRLALAIWEHAALHWNTKALAALAALAAGGAYMLLTGAHVPIIRSFSMASLFTLAVVSGRRAVSLRGLAIAAAVLMLISPSEVMGVSFQMSFSAVLALIAGYAALRPWLRAVRGGGRGRGPVRHVAHHIVGLALTSALAGTASAPYGAYHFGHAQAYFIIANMAAVPLTALWVMPAGLIALALMPLHLEAVALVPMGWGIDAVLWIGRTVSSWPAATFAVPHMPDWGLAVVSLGIAWLGLWRTRLRLAGLALIAAGVASPAFDRPPDLLISADARLIGLRIPAGMLLQSGSGASKFTRDAWEQRWSLTAPQPFPRVGEAAGGAVACIATACAMRPNPAGDLALLLRGPPGPDACDAGLLLSAEPIRLRCPAERLRIDRFDVWRNGAHAVWLEPAGPRIVSDRVTRGARPWVPPLPTRGHVPAGLQPAEVEILPPE